MNIDTTYRTVSPSILARRKAADYLGLSQENRNRYKPLMRRKSFRRFTPWLLLCFAVLILIVIYRFAN